MTHNIKKAFWGGVLFSLLGICISACSLLHHSSGKAGSSLKDYVLYPPKPDTPRLQYLTTVNDSRFLGKRSKFSTFILGPEITSFVNKPYIATIKDSKMYICDGGTSSISIVDFNTKNWNNFTPSGGGALKTPLTLAVDNDHNIYVGDVGRHEVMIYDSSRKFVNAIKDTGDFKPTDVFIYGNDLWVTNPNAHCLNVYDKNTLALKNTFGKYELGDDGFLYSPFNIFITKDKVYITDFGDFKIKIFDRDGKFLSSVGSYGTSLGQFVRPKGICADREDNLFVVDAGFENTQIFNKDGQLLMFFGGPYQGHGDMWLPQKITIDYDNLQYFQKFVAPGFDLKYVLVVCNQYGPDKVNVYGALVPKK